MISLPLLAEVGPWRIYALDGGRFRLDGGAMFGVVPRPLWQKVSPPDEQNRIRMAANCLLAQRAGQTILVDTGYGGKLSEKELDFNAATPRDPLPAALSAAGVSPDEIDAVVLTHLHFDHAGGCTKFNAHGELVPAFPRARYYVQRSEWEDATGGAAELRGSYPLDNLLPLQEAGCLELLEGDVEIFPGLKTIVTGGHTRGHQALLFESADGAQGALYPGDLCPTTNHLRTAWCMSYDMEVIQSRRRKPELLGRAADHQWLVMWCHDPDIAACRLERDPRREFTIVEPILARP